MTTETVSVRSLDAAFLTRTFHAFAAVALAALAINVAGRWFGASIALGGHTEATTRHEIVIGNDVIVAPANAIRYERARRDGVAERLDLYFLWPDMSGYTAAARDAFNAAEGKRALLFATFEQRAMSRDMSGRLAPIYRSLIAPLGAAGPAGVVFYDFTEKSGYQGERLAVLERPGAEPLVARCLYGEAAAQSLAPCERDIHVGGDLSLTYRFPEEWLADWPALERAVRAKALDMVKTAPK